MGTSIRSNLSRRNRYWISRHRYYELKHFCLQYSEWLTEYRSIDGYQKSSRMNLTGVKSTAISDATERLTEAKMYYFERMSLVKSLCKEADPELSDYIFKAVTEEVSYSTLRTKYDIPCSKDYYYESYRKFFWLLSNARK